MSCSCNNCNQNPCCCDQTCDPANEPLSSALENFITAFYGTVTKTCVDGEVQWILPCDLDSGIPGFERRQGEGTACYLLRLFEYLASVSSGGLTVQEEGANVATGVTTLDFTGGGVTATGAGATATINVPCNSFYNKITIEGECYDTWQAAYDANVAAASPTIMLVGQGTTFGDLTLAAAYNTNIVIMGLGRSVSNLGNITGNGFAVSLAAFNIQMGDVTSSGAAITLAGLNTSFGAVSSANGAGAGGAIIIGPAMECTTITSTGSTAGGSITVGTTSSIGIIDSSGTSGLGGNVILGREVVGLAVTASGLAGGTIVLGDECTVGAVTTKPLAAPGTGGAITIGDDCVTGAITNSGTVAGTFGGAILIGDRCEGGAIDSSGTVDGGFVTIGEGFTGTSISCQGTGGIGGSIVISHRLTLTSNVNCAGLVNGGAVFIGQNANLGSSNITGTGTTGTSGPVTLLDGSMFATLSFNAGTNVGNISFGKFCSVGSMNFVTTGGTRGTFALGDGCTVSGTITGTSSGNGGDITIGNSVTITGNVNFDCSGAGNQGTTLIGNGCAMANFRAGANSGSAGTITIGSATTIGQLYGGTAGGAGRVGATIIIGEGSRVNDVYFSAANPGGDAGSITMRAGAKASYIEASSNTGIGGNVTLENANTVEGLNNFAIVMGSSNTGTLKITNGKIRDLIDNVNGSSLFRDTVFSTPAGNRDCIANITASGSQYTNCLFVPNGTGVSIQAGVARTVIAYFMLQKNPFPANVTLSEGSDTVSANLLAP